MGHRHGQGIDTGHYCRRMDFALMFANTGRFAGPAGARMVGPAAEAAGFESLWTVEHVLYPEGYESTYPYSPTGKMPGSADSPIPDPMAWLSFVGATTSTIKLATGILILPQRNPAVLAKEVATVDALTEGRVILGIGVGWLEEEFDALGVPFRQRGKRTDEYVDVMRTLWSGDQVTYDGEFVTYPEVSSNPKPHSGPVPIHVGGHSRKAAERAGRLGDGFFPGTGNIPELFDIARQTAADAGRDPEAISFTAGHPNMLKDAAGAVEELESWGASRAVVPAFIFDRADDPAEAMAAFMANVR